MGAINLLAKRDKTGGDFCYSESLLSGGRFLLVNPCSRGGGMGAGELGELEPRGEGIGRGMGTVKLLNANGELYKPVIMKL